MDAASWCSARHSASETDNHDHGARQPSDADGPLASHLAVSSAAWALLELAKLAAASSRDRTLAVAGFWLWDSVPKPQGALNGAPTLAPPVGASAATRVAEVEVRGAP